MRCSTCSLESPGVRDFCPHCGVAMIGEGNVPHLGNYRLDSKLGEGGMGVVYQAMDEKLHREVAIKVLHPHLLQNENLKERFRREARMHAKLMHQNVVTLLSIYEDGEHMALVMEMVHGKNLKEYIRDNPNLNLVDLVRISDAILAGLEAAHHLGMVHRDLKPANVLISDEGAVKLMDFGLAKPERGEDDLTQSGATVGSFRYMAPEQILNQPVDARTDLYAFGILLYQVCTGRLPFDATASGGGEFEIMEKQVRETPVAPHELVPSLPRPLSDLILQLLAKNAADRPANCAAVRRSLHGLLKQDVPEQRLQAVRMPTRQANEDSSAKIAKGLLRAMWQQVYGTFHTTGGAFRSAVAAMQGRIEKSASSLPVARRWQAPLTWGSITLSVLFLGWILISVIGLAERSAKSEADVKNGVPRIEESLKPVAEKSDAVKETPQPMPQQEPEVAEKPAVAAAPVAEQKPVTAPAPKPKPVVKAAEKPKPKPKPVVRTVHSSVASSIPHKVIRSDFSNADPKSHEFLGGSYLWFTSLKDYKWKDKYRSYKKGETKIILDESVNLSRIVLNKASVGRLDFKGGEVSLAVKNSRGQWTELFERKDDDVDIAVTLTKPAAALNDVKSVRLRFKTPEPITVGPIDLIR
ncbi:MAG: protein kinase [Mariprofundaceae bacterium]|nr:protein kinase [Mariprofundaceae bacterium]